MTHNFNFINSKKIFARNWNNCSLETIVYGKKVTRLEPGKDLANISKSWSISAGAEDAEGGVKPWAMSVLLEEIILITD